MEEQARCDKQCERAWPIQTYVEKKHKERDPSDKTPPCNTPHLVLVQGGHHEMRMPEYQIGIPYSLRGEHQNDEEGEWERKEFLKQKLPVVRSEPKH